MPSPRIIASNCCMLGTSNSDTIVQYCSAQKSVMTRILPSPAFSLSLDMARNLSSIGRTLPGLQYIISRIITISSPRVGLSIMDSHTLEVNDRGDHADRTLVGGSCQRAQIIPIVGSDD